MHQYLELLKRILTEGEDVQSGAVIKSEDRKATCRMLLGQQLRFDLRAGFPSITTKPIAFDVVVDEVFWFLRGETNINTLGRVVDGKFVRRKIWDAWSQPDGDVPKIYGRAWRRWDYPEDDRLEISHESMVSRVKVWDQINYVLEQLKAVVADPGHRARRRIILTAWDPPVVPHMGLAPCHTLSQFLPTNGYLDVVCHWRSIDTYLGMPFNICQYALLAHIFGELAELTPRYLVANIADCHLYDNQYDQVREQITREPRPLPRLVIDERFFRQCYELKIDQLRTLDPTWFKLEGYTPHAGQPGGRRPEVAV